MNDHHEQPGWDAIYGEPTLALVIGDFGRAATARFCAALCEAEQRVIRQRLPEGAPFFDEYRRITLALAADLRYLKAEHLARFAALRQPLDDSILVGFRGGPLMQQVAARIGVLVLESLAGPVARGCAAAQVLLPCNTLAPASQWLAERFASAEGIAELLDVAGVPDERRRALAAIAAAALERTALRFPTVPEAVLQLLADSGGADAAALVLGTEGTPRAYVEAAARGRGSTVTLLDVQPSWQAVTLDAIRAAIADDPLARAAAREALERVGREADAAHGAAVTLIEGCTDLDYGVGLDSAAAYAEALVRVVHSV